MSARATLDRLLPVSVIPTDAPWSDVSERAVVEAFAREFTLRDREPTEDWLYRKIRIEGNQSADYAGEPYDIRRVPHARLIFDFLADPDAEELIVMKSSAAALSTATIGACVHMLEDDPGNILYLISNKEEATKLAKQVWKPFLRQVFGRAVDAEDQGNLHMHINGAEIFSGSPTENFMRNKQVKLLVEDESDTMDDTLTGGGQDLETAQKERTKGSRKSKIIRLSTPLFKFDPKRSHTRQPQTRIHRNFLRGDQREYRCPCPGCGLENPIVETDLHSDHCRELDGTWNLDRVQDETYWRCSACGHAVHDGSREKSEMINAGRWVPTKTSESKRVWSAQHTDLIALIGKASWGYIRKELLRTKGTMQHAAVRRSHLAEPEDKQDSGPSRDRETILRHCGAYRRGECPVVPWFVALTVDVQHDASRFPYMISAVGNLGDIHVIDWGEVKDFDDLYLRDRAGNRSGLYACPIPLNIPRSLAEKHFPDGRVPSHIFIRRALIDSGHYARGSSTQRDESNVAQESVYGFCMRSWSVKENRFLFLPVKGRGGMQIHSLTLDSEVMVHGAKLPLIHFEDPAFKRDMYNIRLASNPEHPLPLARDRPRIHFPCKDDMDDMLLDQLCSERLVDKLVKNPAGRMEEKRVWDNDGPNDLGDTLKLNLVLYEVMRRWTLATTQAA